jgi:hypothetical protein
MHQIDELGLICSVFGAMKKNLLRAIQKFPEGGTLKVARMDFFNMTCNVNPVTG